jgi:hypothetical protein
VKNVVSFFFFALLFCCCRFDYSLLQTLPEYWRGFESFLERSLGKIVVSRAVEQRVPTLWQKGAHGLSVRCFHADNRGGTGTGQDRRSEATVSDYDTKAK